MTRTRRSTQAGECDGAAGHSSCPARELTAHQPEDDLLLAMVRTDDDGEDRWARMVPLES